MTVSQFSQLHESFSALKIKQFRWFLLSAVGNSGGMQLQQLLRGYLVYDMTGSFAMLGLLSLLQSIPLLTLSMFGGVLADRMSKKLLVQIGHVVSGINVLVLAILLTQNALTIEILAITAIISGGTISIAMPARAAMIPHLVPKNSLTNAVILNGASMQVMRLIAPTIGGWATAVYGPDLGYFLNTGLFICGFIAIACTPFVQEDVANNKNKENTIKSVLQDIKDTFTYLKNNEISFIEDSSNFESNQDRNFIRNDIIPLIEERWKNISSRIQATSEIIRGRNKSYSYLLDKNFNHLIKNKIPVKDLKKVDSEILVDILRTSIREQDICLPSKKITKEIIKTFILSRPGPRSEVSWSRDDQDLPGGSAIYRDGCIVILKK